MVFRMATGDIKNNLRKLVNSLKGVKYEKDVDYESLANGVPASYLPIYHYGFMNYSRPIATEISGLGIDLLGRSDQRFVEGMYKVLREMFTYKPPITKDQFFSNGFAERKVIMATEILNMLKTRHKALTPKPKVKVNVSMTSMPANPKPKVNTSMNSTLSMGKPNTKQKPRSAPAAPTQINTMEQKKHLTASKRPCSTVLPQVVSEVRAPSEITAALSDSGAFVASTNILDVTPVPAPAYNPLAYSGLPSDRDRLSSVEIVSLQEEPDPCDGAVRPIDVVKTPGRPLIESHRHPPAPPQPVTSSPVEPEITTTLLQKLTRVVQENEGLSTKLLEVMKLLETMKQEKENLAARVTLLENKVQLLEHKNAQLPTQPEVPGVQKVTEVEPSPDTSLSSQDPKENKENINDQFCDGQLDRSDTEHQSVTPSPARTDVVKTSLSCLDSTSQQKTTMDNQAERIRLMMTNTENLLGMKGTVSQE